MHFNCLKMLLFAFKKAHPPLTNIQKKYSQNNLLFFGRAYEVGCLSLGEVIEGFGCCTPSPHCCYRLSIVFWVPFLSVFEPTSRDWWSKVLKFWLISVWFWASNLLSPMQSNLLLASSFWKLARKSWLLCLGIMFGFKFWKKMYLLIKRGHFLKKNNLLKQNELISQIKYQIKKKKHNLFNKWRNLLRKIIYKNE